MSSVSNSSQATNDFDVAGNVFNHNSITYFSSKGVGAFIEVAEKENQDFSTLDLSLYRGSDRRTKFELEYLNKDGEFEGTIPHIFVSSGRTEAAETYNFEKVDTSKFKITFKGNIDNNQFVDPHDLEDVKLKPQFLQTLDHAYKNHQKDTSGDVGPNKQFLSIRSLRFYQAEGKQDKIDVDEHYEKIAKLFPLKFNKYSNAFYLSTESEKPKSKKKEAPKKKDTKPEDKKEEKKDTKQLEANGYLEDSDAPKENKKEKNDEKKKYDSILENDYLETKENAKENEPKEDTISNFNDSIPENEPKKEDKDFYGELGNSNIIGTGGLDESLDSRTDKKKK